MNNILLVNKSARRTKMTRASQKEGKYVGIPNPYLLPVSVQSSNSVFNKFANANRGTELLSYDLLRQYKKETGNGIRNIERNLWKKLMGKTL